MGNLIWKVIRNLPYYGLVLLVILGGAYTGVIAGIYSIILGTYAGVAGFLGVGFTNLIFGVIGVITIFTIINMFYERE